MRIAHLVSRFPALSHTFIENQIIDCIELGHEVEVYANGSLEPDKEVHPDVKKYELDKSTLYSPAMPESRIPRVAKALPLITKALVRQPAATVKSLNPGRFGVHATSLRLLYGLMPFLGAPEYDIVHCHFGPTGVNAVFLKQLGLLRGPIITTFYGYDIHRFPPKWNTIGYTPLKNHQSRLLALSERMKEELIEIGFEADRIHVHHLAIDCDKFAFRERRLSPGEAPRLVTIARLVPKKAVAHAIEAVAEIRDEFPEIQYHILGDGPLRPELETLIAKKSLQGVVHLAGWKTQDEVICYLNQAHLFLLPSITVSDGDQEGTPTVLMEAMAMGIPVLSTLHSGIPEVVPDGKAGFLVEENDIGALSERLRYLLRTPGRWPELGRAGRKRAELEFNRKVLRDRLLEHYREAKKTD